MGHLLLAFGLALLSCASSQLILSRQNQPESIRGVNLGGWFLIEEWITPTLFRRSGAHDEYHLCAALGKDACRSRLEQHWDSFYSRDDFEQMRDVGLNSVRIPIGYWAVDVRDDEPYVAGQYPYLIRAVNWAREFGLSVLIDLHGVPGSQNGYDHSGIIGPVQFASNTSNLERSYAVLGNLSAEFAKQEYGWIVWGIQLLNEPRLTDSFSMDTLKQYYSAGSQTVRSASSDFSVIVHDAFWGVQYWNDYNPADAQSSQSPSYLVVDTHQYYAFPPLANLSHSDILGNVCQMSNTFKARNRNLPKIIVGEWSLESGRPPDPTIAAEQGREGSQEKRTWLRTLFEAQLAAYSPRGNDQPILGWYFWTWKTYWDIDTWSYNRGVQDGWIPSDVSNSSTYVFPVLDNNCIDESFNYTAPRHPGSAQRSSSPGYTSLLLAFVLGVAYTGIGSWM